jgi:hypothetical protein
MKSVLRLIILSTLCSTLLAPMLRAIEPGFISLLDRDHIRDWKQSGQGKLSVNGDIATTSFPKGKGYFGVTWYSKQTFTDFDFRVEFRGVGPEFNSGLRLRFPDPGDDPGSVSKNGYEVCINHPGAGDTPATGGIQRAQPPTSSPLRGKDQWNDLEVTAIGQQYIVKLNGQVVNEFIGSKNLSGYVGIENHTSGSVEFRNVRIKDLSAPGSQMVTPATPQQLTAAPTAALTLDPNQPLLDTFSQLAPNASAWVLAALDEGVPPNVRQNLTYLREDLLDEYKQKPKASQDAYRAAHQLCSTMIAALDERDQTLVRAGFRAVQADANATISGNQALNARRNYMMSWPQYAREQAQRAELRSEASNKSQVMKEQPKVEWSTRTAALRRTLDDLYAKFREALRQSPPVK